MKNYRVFRLLAFFLGCTVASFASVGCRETEADPPGPSEIRIPKETGFTFPTEEKFFATATYDQIRSHAWAVFAGIIQHSDKDDPCSPAIWDTWFSGVQPPSKKGYEKTAQPVRLEVSLETLAAILQSLKPKRRAGKNFQLDDNFWQTILQAVHNGNQQVLFNSAAHAEIVDKTLYDTNTLKSLNAAASATVADRKIESFPKKSIIVKASWKSIPATGTFSVSLWYVDKNTPGCDNGCFRDTIVAKAGEGEKCNLPVKGDAAVLSSCFYTVNDDGLSGNVLILTGLHVITKEAPDWTWSTFWWSSSANEGDYSNGRFDAPIIDGPWRNYLMNTTVSMALPNEPAATAAISQPAFKDPCGQNWHTPSNAKVDFNPYIEMPVETMPNARLSNCMNCHKRSTFPGFAKDMRGTPWRGELSSDAGCFSKHIRLDYLWSLSPLDSKSPLLLLYQQVLKKLQADLPARYEFH